MSTISLILILAALIIGTLFSELAIRSKVVSVRPSLWMTSCLYFVGALLGLTDEIFSRVQFNDLFSANILRGLLGISLLVLFSASALTYDMTVYLKHQYSIYQGRKRRNNN